MSNKIHVVYVLEDNSWGWYQIRKPNVPRTIDGIHHACQRGAPHRTASNGMREALWYVFKGAGKFYLGACRRWDDTNGKRGVYPSVEAAVMAAVMMEK